MKDKLCIAAERVTGPDSFELITACLLAGLDGRLAQPPLLY
jgi:hypothetical protein